MRIFLLSMGLLPFKPQVCRERKGTYVRTSSSGRKFIILPRIGEGDNEDLGGLENGKGIIAERQPWRTT
jgi:hypothetical protein